MSLFDYDEPINEEFLIECGFIRIGKHKWASIFTYNYEIENGQFIFKHRKIYFNDKKNILTVGDDTYDIKDRNDLIILHDQLTKPIIPEDIAKFCDLKGDLF